MLGWRGEEILDLRAGRRPAEGGKLLSKPLPAASSSPSPPARLRVTDIDSWTALLVIRQSMAHMDVQ